MNRFPKVNFIGNKEKISSWIANHIPTDVNSIFDAFSGGGSVSYHAKALGLKVISNDILEINHMLSKALIENNNEVLSDEDIDTIFEGTPTKGFMYKHYSNVYFFPEECKELDLYRENIKKLSSDNKKALAFILIRRAMVRKMPYSRFTINWEKIIQLRDEDYSYLKYKRKRAYHNDSFKAHFLSNLPAYNNAVFDNGQDNISIKGDIFDVATTVHADLIYLDPPYTGTMNNYFGFYGVIDEYINSKKIEPFQNNFVDKSTSIDLFDKLFSKLQNFKYWMLSYNNSSYPTKEQLIEIIGKYSRNIQVIEKPHVYKITGKEKKKTNTEYLFLIKNDSYEASSKTGRY